MSEATICQIKYLYMSAASHISNLEEITVFLTFENGFFYFLNKADKP